MLKRGSLSSFDENSRKKMAEENGPQLPPHLTKAKHSDDSCDDEEEPVYGPVIPRNNSNRKQDVPIEKCLLKTSDGLSELDGENKQKSVATFGPALPPHLIKQTEKRILGPALPEHLRDGGGNTSEGSLYLEKMTDRRREILSPIALPTKVAEGGSPLPPEVLAVKSQIFLHKNFKYTVPIACPHLQTIQATPELSCTFMLGCRVWHFSLRSQVRQSVTHVRCTKFAKFLSSAPFKCANSFIYHFFIYYCKQRRSTLVAALFT